jgi:arylsulfatase A-like enzyme
MKRNTLLAALSLLLISLETVRPGVAPKADQPNIIVILVDDQGYGDFSCTGNPIMKTPQMDRMHDEGVRFTDFHVSPTCSPTRCALMSGAHEFKSGVTHTILERERMSLATVTLAQMLKSAGYNTGIFGKWHLGDEDAYQPDRRGFDEVFIHGGGGIGQNFPGSCGDVPGNKYFNPVIKHNGRFEKTTGFCTDIFTAQALKWIASVKGTKPFFCYIPFNAAHEPLSCPPEFKKPYEGKVPDKVATFYGMLANIDENVGHVMARLKEWGIDTNTLVVLMNDNGGYAPACEVYNAGMKGSKASAWEGGTRAVSFWWWPGTLKPATVDQLTSVIDLFPTFAELAGATLDTKVKAQVEGRSLIPLLRNPETPWADRNLFTHVGRWGGMTPGAPPEKYMNDDCGVRNSRFSLVRGATDWKLYDLKNDPGQTNDIAAQQPEVVKQLSAAYDQWWTNVLPDLVNEDAFKTAPKLNPFKEEYWKQFGGGYNSSAKRDAYVLEYFGGSDGQEALYMAYSYDALHWTALNNNLPILKSTVGNKSIRDPYILRKLDQSFILMCTDSSRTNTENAVFWDSKDLITFTNERLVRLNSVNQHVWAPECVYDSTHQTYIVYWAGNVIYANTTTDFINFTPAKEFFNPGYICIDSDIVSENGTNYLFYKDETGENTPRGTTGKAIKVARSTSFKFDKTGVFTPDYITDHLVEGPACIKDLEKNRWYLYYDYFFRGGVWGCSYTDDLSSGKWVKMDGTQYSLPKGVRHGNAVKVTSKELVAIIEAYNGSLKTSTPAEEDGMTKPPTFKKTGGPKL